MKELRIKRNDPQLSEIQRGGLKAFEMLFRQYYAVLCAYGHKYVDFHDAEEIVQDSLLWIWENRENLIIESSLSSYLFKMVHHKALNKLAHIDAIKRADTRFYEEMQEMIQDMDFYQIKELTKRIEEAVTALPESYRQAFVMHPGYELQRNCRNIGSVSKDCRLSYSASTQAITHRFKRLSAIAASFTVSLI